MLPVAEDGDVEAALEDDDGLLFWRGRTAYLSPFTTTPLSRARENANWSHVKRMMIAPTYGTKKSIVELACLCR